MIWEKLGTGVHMATAIVGDASGTGSVNCVGFRDALVEAAKAAGLGPACVETSERYSDYVTATVVSPRGECCHEVADRMRAFFKALKWYRVGFSRNPGANCVLVMAYRKEAITV